MSKRYFLKPLNEDISLEGEDIEIIPIERAMSKDLEYNSFIENLFKNDIKQLIIPVTLWENDVDHSGLYLGLHIRLSQTLQDKRFIPIVFVSEESAEEILFDQIKNEKVRSAMLLFTKGVKLVTWENATELFEEKIASEKDFIENVYKNLIIDAPKNRGNHSLANQWGVIQLAEAANISEDDYSNDKLKSFKSDIYVKYLLSRHFRSNENGRSITQENRDWKDSIKDKKILLIDDEANKGWEKVLRKIFEGATLEVKAVAKWEDLATEKENFEKGFYDLILLDLRLNPEKEEKTEFIQFAKTTDYSGSKILCEIKKLNQGNQVIIFTASNKAWNMKELMQAGYEIDGYYIKESPAFYFGKENSLANYQKFQNEVRTAFEKGAYLRKIFLQTSEIQTRLETLQNYPDGFVSDISTQLDLTNSYLKTIIPDISTKENKLYAYAFLAYFRILEILKEQLIIYYENSRRVYELQNKVKLNGYKYNEPNKRKSKPEECIIIDINDNPSLFVEIANVYFGFIGSDISKSEDNQFVCNLQKDIYKRNNFIHSAKTLSEEELKQLETSNYLLEFWGRVYILLTKLPQSAT